MKLDATDDLSEPRAAAKLKHDESELRGLVDRNHSKLNGLALHMFGEKAEFAACIMARAKYIPKVNVFGSVPDQFGCDIKAATSHYFNLILRDPAPPQRPIILITSRDEYGQDWFMQGWTYWPIALKIGKWVNPNAMGKCLKVYTDKLYPMDTCPIVLP